MNRFIQIVVLTLALSACQNVQQPQAPENLIGRETMVQILADAYVGNAARSINNRLLRNEGILLDSVLYTKYSIDSTQFARSNAYYVSNLNNYTKMFEDVEKILLERKVKVDTLLAQEKRAAKKRRDSLRRRDSMAGKPLSKPKSNKKSQRPGLVDPVQDE